MPTPKPFLNGEVIKDRGSNRLSGKGELGLRGNIEYRGIIKKLDQYGFGRCAYCQPSNADIYGGIPYDLDPNMVEVE